MKPIDHYRPIFMGWVGFLVFSFTFLPFGQSASLGRPFLTIFSDQSQAKLVKDCQEDDIQSCQLVSVDFDALREAQTFLVPNSHSVLLERVTKIDGDDDSIDSYFYQDQFGSTAILTVTGPASRYPRLTATITLHHKHAKPAETLHYIENCGIDCHVYIVEGSDKKESIMDGVQPDESETEGAVSEEDAELGNDDDDDDDDQMDDRQSSQSPTIINVMFYYTDEFEDVTSDIVGYVNQQIMATNLGYQMSNINLKARVFCIEKIANFRESGSPISLLQNFARLKRSRNSADIAILLLSKVKDRVCGIAYTDALRTRSRLSFGWIAKGCPSHTLGHEIGHTFGALHNREISQGSVPRGGYAYGNLITLENGTPSGRHSIMAYTAPNYELTVNCYSGPDVICQGLVTGDHRNDVKRVLVGRKLGMSRIGNERNACRGLSATTTTTTISTTTSTSTTTSLAIESSTDTEDPQETVSDTGTETVTDNPDPGTSTTTTTTSTTTTVAPAKGSSVVCRLCRRLYCVVYPAYCYICNRPCGV